MSLLSGFLMLYAPLWLVGGSNPRLGDVLVIAGSTLYAVSNVSEVSKHTIFLVSRNDKKFLNMTMRLKLVPISIIIDHDVISTKQRVNMGKVFIKMLLRFCIVNSLFPFLTQEFLVKNADRVELMAMLGFFGAIVSAIQMYPLVLDLGI